MAQGAGGGGSGLGGGGRGRRLFATTGGGGGGGGGEPTGPWGKYLQLLESNPFLTRAVTCGVLNGLGEHRTHASNAINRALCSIVHTGSIRASL